MKELKCNGCGKTLKKGALKYIVEIKSFADFDGYLEDYDGDIEEGINELIVAIENMDQRALEEDVAKEIIYILCKTCRDMFTKDPFCAVSGAPHEEEAKGTLH
ncbi:MAG: hypothetical protein HY886_04300 [Deltaproteobacteria bacterium]|nr:hypothetical protein [Deltaproteobacteria bacterium]